MCTSFTCPLQLITSEEEIIKMRRTPILAFLLLSCCLIYLTDAHEYFSEVDVLQQLIKSRPSLDLSSLSIQLPNSSNTFSPVYVGPQDCLMEADKIDSLPGQPQGVNFDQYAGYVTVDPTAERALFYYFVESPQDPTTKPLVLWLNGGPGCSSVGIGGMTELGPFRPNSDGKTLKANEYAWNNVANVIFLESPAGVGFSYSNTTSDYESNDDGRTAHDALTFLVNWLERFPQYKTRDFFITGENYAGHYIPELASTILAYNKITNGTVINLKGIAMGNALIDLNTNLKAVYEYYWTHALISDEIYETIQSQCDFVNANYNDECSNATAYTGIEIGLIDGYSIYAPLCKSPSDLTTTSLKDVGPCMRNYTKSYLNLQDVQKALHANVTILPYPWTQCSYHFGPRSRSDYFTSMLPTIKELLGTGISVWLYSGDQDSVVPVTATRYAINMLGLSIEQFWRPWYTDGEVGGYIVAYKGLRFATVRGAGHMVPTDQPQRALTLISSFLQGNLPPSA